MLPVVETEILPTKHYVPPNDTDGNKILIEIPESQVPERTGQSPSRNWNIRRTSIGKRDRNAPAHHIKIPSQVQDIESDEGADGPVIGLVRSEPRMTRYRGNSKSSIFSNSSHTKSPSKSPNPLAATLSKRKSVTKEGVPKTEYVRRYPPVFENSSGQTQGPVYIAAGLGNLSAVEYNRYYSDEDDIEGAEFGAVMKLARGEEDLLFRDSGYGFGGMLPGLVEMAPMVKGMPLGRVLDDDRDGVCSNRVGKVKVASNAGAEGEATKGLRHMRGRRRSSAASQGSGWH